MNPVWSRVWLQQRMVYVLSVLIAVGALTLLILAMELNNPLWSRPAIGFQSMAALLAFIMLAAQRPISRRFIIYPLLLATVTYLWDATLPPPTLPEGLVRNLVPRLVVSGLIADVVVVALQRRREASAARRAQRATREPNLRIQVRGGLVPLEETAALFGVTPAELSERLHRIGCKVIVRDTLYVHIHDLLAVIEHWHADDPMHQKPNPWKPNSHNGSHP